MFAEPALAHLDVRRLRRPAEADAAIAAFASGR